MTEHWAAHEWFLRSFYMDSFKNSPRWELVIQIHVSDINSSWPQLLFPVKEEFTTFYIKSICWEVSAQFKNCVKSSGLERTFCASIGSFNQEGQIDFSQCNNLKKWMLKKDDADIMLPLMKYVLRCRESAQILHCHYCVTYQAWWYWHCDYPSHRNYQWLDNMDLRSHSRIISSWLYNYHANRGHHSLYIHNINPLILLGTTLSRTIY